MLGILLEKIIYGAKTLFHGDVIGKDHSIQMVGVPDNKKITAVLFQGDTMYLKGKKVLGYRVFEDKFGRNKTYTLKYYEWKPSAKEVETISMFETPSVDHVKRMLQIREELKKQGKL